MFQLTPVVKNLLIVNVVVFLLGYLVYSQTGIYINNYLALYYFESDNFQPWQIVTYMFLHADFRHIFGNMIGLLVFGPWLEQAWGPKRFFQYYIITGVGAGILFMGVDFFEKSAVLSDAKTVIEEPSPEQFDLLISQHFSGYYGSLSDFIDAYYERPENPQYERQAVSYVKELYTSTLNRPMVGASGAIFGILMAAGLLFPYRKIMLLIPPIPLRARILVIVYGAYTVYAAFQRSPDDSIAHVAHLGGMLVGFILLKIWDEDRNRYH